MLVLVLVMRTGQMGRLRRDVTLGHTVPSSSSSFLCGRIYHGGFSEKTARGEDGVGA